LGEQLAHLLRLAVQRRSVELFLMHKRTLAWPSRAAGPGRAPPADTRRTSIRVQYVRLMMIPPIGGARSAVNAICCEYE
jgi:hypothetical protein